MSFVPSGKRLIRLTLNRLGYDCRRIRFDNAVDYSQFEERPLIDSYLEKVKVRHRVYVDIGAVNGLLLSNTHHLATAGWSGVAIEYNPNSFRDLAWYYERLLHIDLYRVKATPNNIVPILKASDVPPDFDFLNLDIDSYDYFVLESLLAEFRPRLACVEINPRVPPPVRFAVKYDPNFVPLPDFFGYSLAQLAELCRRTKYAVVGLNYVNAFIVPNDLWNDRVEPLETIYKLGYASRADKYERLPQDREWADLIDAPPDRVVQMLQRRFSHYADRYVLAYP